MATRPPSWIPWRRGVLLDDVFDDDLKRLWFLYRRHGFEDAQIVDTHTRFDAESGKVYIEVVVDEGRQTIVREIIQSGTELLASAPPALQTTVNQPLDPEQVDADRRALSDAFARLGYAAAAVTTDVSTRPDGATDAATVRFTVVPGEQRRVGTIIVQDDIDTRWRVITRELPFKSGDPLDPEALLEGQSALSRLGLFRSVQVRPLDTKPEGTPGTSRGCDARCGCERIREPTGNVSVGGGLQHARRLSRLHGSGVQQLARFGAAHQSARRVRDRAEQRPE